MTVNDLDRPLANQNWPEAHQLDDEGHWGAQPMPIAWTRRLRWAALGFVIAGALILALVLSGCDQCTG